MINVTRDELESTILSVSDDEDEEKQSEKRYESKRVTADDLIEDMVKEFEQRFLSRKQTFEEEKEIDSKRSDDSILQYRHTTSINNEKELLDMVERFRPKQRTQTSSGRSGGKPKNLGRLLCRYAKRKSSLRSSNGSLMRVKAYDSHGNLITSVRNSRRFDSDS